jgi:hypothetical protein
MVISCIVWERKAGGTLARRLTDPVIAGQA